MKEKGKGEGVTSHRARGASAVPAAAAAPSHDQN